MYLCSCPRLPSRQVQHIDRLFIDGGREWAVKKRWKSHWVASGGGAVGENWLRGWKLNTDLQSCLTAGVSLLPWGRRPPLLARLVVLTCPVLASHADFFQISSKRPRWWAFSLNIDLFCQLVTLFSLLSSVTFNWGFLIFSLRKQGQPQIRRIFIQSLFLPESIMPTSPAGRKVSLWNGCCMFINWNEATSDRNVCHSDSSTSHLSPTQQQAPIWLYIKQQTNKQENVGAFNCVLIMRPQYKLNHTVCQ